MKENSAEYKFLEIENFWQNHWDANGIFTAKIDISSKKFYVLDMFPYPSGTGLHIGHPEGYTASDIVARFKKANGFNVLHPMGWDAFGLPAEQHAIATGQHPALNTKTNVDNFRRQIKALGFAIDWSREINTTDDDYIKWTQWIFLQLFKHGLAYVAEKPVWWCPALKSVLANEEVIDEKSEGGDHPVERKNMRQWVLRITDYADKLLEGLEDIDWPNSTKRQQIAWIGKSKGAEIDFKIDGQEDKLSVFTTRADTLFGVTFLVVAPEHPILSKIVTAQNQKVVQDYINQAKRKSDLERTDLAKDKTGIFSGSYAINPINNRKIPIWISDYVLITYGTGAIMAVPAHDSRDHEFAKKFALDVLQVISSEDDNATVLFCSDGKLLNSEKYSGLPSAVARQKIIDDLVADNKGRGNINYKLRDWLFSRQRYWGEPVPILWISKEAYEKISSTDSAELKEFLPKKPVTFEKNGEGLFALPLPSKYLPLKLPATSSYLPSDDGESPLSRIKDWLDVYIDVEKCEIISANDVKDPPKHLIKARRETNTMPQWAGSCWYYLRYLSPNCSTNLVDPQAEKYWGYPDLYIGGAEHAVLHLLYSRFWHRFLYDIGTLTHGKEPFTKLFHQGIILGEDGTKMSKSRGNVINPDEIISRYGADSLRLYEMFLGPLAAMKPWNTSGIEGVHRFLKKVWREYIQSDGRLTQFKAVDNQAVSNSLQDTIQKVTADIEAMHFNTAIAQMMIFINGMRQNNGMTLETAKVFLRLLAPFAPHICEELWARSGETSSIYFAKWPTHKGLPIKIDNYKISIQINGKIRGDIPVADNATEDDILASVLKLDGLKKYIDGKSILKKVYVKHKIMNILTN
ncbi:MAG: leucine--tRNA ligase [Puniceicoccales bacterium]|jgi:leucyl-tRNA synthetase|nr:leucine--tRNA ligase [Puniceicoccales bacterium]